VVVAAHWPAPDPDALWTSTVLATVGDALDLPANPWVAGGIVGYADVSTPASDVANDPERWLAGAERLGSWHDLGAGADGLAAAVRDAGKALVRAREDLRLSRAAEAPRETLVLLAPPVRPSPVACRAAATALGELRADGVDVSLVCPPGGCDLQCLGDALPADRHYDPATWAAVADRLAVQARASELRVAELTLRETIPAEFEVITESVDPPTTVVDPHGRALAWHLSVPAGGEQAVRFALRALATGNLVAVDTGYLAFTDTEGRSGSAILGPRRVSVGWRALLPLALREDDSPPDP
jgi:hypothetical protein